MQLLRYMAAVLSAGFPLVAFLQLVRVYGQALAQIADAEVKLFHLFVHEPLIRDGVDGLEIAEEMEGLARELLPLAAPIMEHVHQRWLQHFIEQDVVGHLELEVDSDAELGRLRGRDRLRRPRRLHAADRGGGEEEALDIVERFVEAVEETLPEDARVIKTIGDEVMVVGLGPVRRSSTGPSASSCSTASGGRCRASASTPAARSTATATTTGARSTSPRGSAPRRGRRGAGDPAGRGGRGPPPRVPAHRRGRLKGFDETTELFLASSEEP